MKAKAVKNTGRTGQMAIHTMLKGGNEETLALITIEMKWI